MFNMNSHTGILIYLNIELFIWFKKRKNTVELYRFGSELIALRIAMKTVEALRYKLRKSVIPIDGPAKVFCDIQSVVNNLSSPTSTFNKIQNANC